MTEQMTIKLMNPPHRRLYVCFPPWLRPDAARPGETHTRQPMTRVDFRSGVALVDLRLGKWLCDSGIARVQ